MAQSNGDEILDQVLLKMTACALLSGDVTSEVLEGVRKSADDMVQLILADRKQHELDARIDELSHIKNPARTSKQKYLGLDYAVEDRLAELKAEREAL